MNSPEIQRNSWPVAKRGGNGGPGAIRTPDPQIRRLPQPVESQGFSFKPNTDSGLSDQRLNFSVQTEKRAPNAMQLFAKPAHKRAAKLLGYGLTLDTADGWQAVANVWAVRLTAGERASILMAALASLQPDQAAAILDHAFSGGLQ